MTSKPYFLKQNSPVYSFKSPRRQYFSIPYSLICYFAERPSIRKGYEKLQKTCKYFFSKKKIITVNGNTFWKDNLLYSWIVYGGLNCRELHLGKHQFWLTQILKSYGNEGFGYFCNHIYRCNLSKLMLENQIITLDEINFMLNGGKITYLSLWKVNIRDLQGNPVPIDSILAKTPKASTVFYGNKCETFSSKTFDKLNELKFYGSFSVFILHISNISDEINPLLFAKFIQKNGSQLSTFSIGFSLTFNEIYQKSFEEIAIKAGNLADCYVEVNFGVLK